MNAYNSIVANASRIQKNPAVNPVNGTNQRINPNQVTENQISFNDVFQDKLNEAMQLQFSKHAALRLNGRDINLSQEQLQRVAGGVQEAKAKGIKDSLVLVDNVALLVNVPSSTVVTAINQSNQNIFTNIDGTVIV